MSSIASGRSREQEAGAVDQFDQRLGALLQAGHRGRELGALGVVERGGDLRAAGQIGQRVDERSPISSSSGVARMKWPFMFSSLAKSKRDGERPIAGRSNASIISSVEKNSRSPWLQPSRTR